MNTSGVNNSSLADRSHQWNCSQPRADSANRLHRPTQMQGFTPVTRHDHPDTQCPVAVACVHSVTVTGVLFLAVQKWPGVNALHSKKKKKIDLNQIFSKKSFDLNHDLNQ